ncbi:hypothetical protein [Streptomyces solicathayae]|uniref:Integral membrane protein n=1 Tax=Streptomyces solicathayae TaxID=3081768 RepID=A0ABZ0LZN9_9ACTN|nr:hypothetical protein [Streptomyces sp. HUAS YS2]WOX24842.1 hypothetical protein R2D22_27060 [Streptomyces sp. HUAS YS2]
MAEQQDGGEREPQPIDEEAAWAAIVAGYGEEPADPPGAKPFRSVEDLALPAYEEGSDETEADSGSAEDDDADEDGDEDEDRAVDGKAAGDTWKPTLGSSIVFAPGVGPGAGPRDYSIAEPDDEPVARKKSKGDDEDDEGHFVPPEPPPLPEADATTKFAWIGVIGGPVLMLLAVLFQWEMTWWLTTVCVVGFLGGFATLVGRMKHDDDDDGHDDPGRGAVV